MAILWQAPEAKVEVGTAISSFSTSSSIQTQMAALADEADYSGMVKDLRITGGERDVEVIKLIGYNELLDERRATVVEFVFTIAYQGTIEGFNSALTRQTHHDVAEWFMGEKQTVTGNYMRVIGGEKSANDRENKAVHILLTDGTNDVSILINNARCTGRDLSLAADGSMEATVTFKALASNYYEEDDFA